MQAKRLGYVAANGQWFHTMLMSRGAGRCNALAVAKPLSLLEQNAAVHLFTFFIHELLRL